MRVPFLLALIPGLWVYGPADAMNDKDLPLMVIYMTWVAISTLYFVWTMFRQKEWSDDAALAYRINAWFLLGVILAVAVPTIIETTSSILVIMYSAL